MAANPGNDGGQPKTMQLENTEKRDTLKDIELKYQKIWQADNLFDVEAPSLVDIPGDVSSQELHSKVPKFFGTMAYPYTNGVGHLGHAYTISKADFMSRTARHLGKRTLYPQGFHVTGMPIKAAADKIALEVEKFGKDFNVPDEEDASASEPTPAAKEAPKADVAAGKFKAKKGKAALKGAGSRYQFQTMLSMGVPREIIHTFADPLQWVKYFPNLWKRDLIALGCSTTWKRSFVTSDINPYYDSFVQWQMRKLKAQNRIAFGKRFTVYSPLDQQACLDHDRSSGEGVNVQEYTALKNRVVKWSEAATKVLDGALPADSNVYLVAATLRPETMYGQSNLFVSPHITYGIFKAKSGDYILATKRAARNIAYNASIFEWGVVNLVAEIDGKDLVGTEVVAPLAALKSIYVVPMDTIKATKATGVVTCVASDSPDDFAMIRELAKKPAFYGIEASWVPTEHLPIIETPQYGNLTAKALVEKMKISSPKDAAQLALAKEEAYKEGFYKGKMIYGEFAGKPVQEAKELVRQQLLDSGDAFVYAEPDGLVISRSGDDCVAGLLDQWYLTYGDADPEWRQQVLDHVLNKDGENFNSYSKETGNALERVLSWLNSWAVTRSFGLGTRLPWDKTNLVESLSDSTIYMAYYTVAHILHKDMFGHEPTTFGITPDQMTDEVWEYIFDLRDDVQSAISRGTLEHMRREFKFWYPLDVRISGKDLLNNHLCFFLYIHTAIWNEPRTLQYRPRGIRVNGHALLNGEKMSKSTGNFLTMYDAVEKFGADALRISLADAGDGVEDANIAEDLANSSVLRLFELKSWIESVILEPRILKEGEDYDSVREKEKVKNVETILRSGKKSFWDEIFENEMNILASEAIEQYSESNFKAALKAGYFDFQGALSTYRTTAIGGLHADSVRRYVELQTILLAVVTPHWSEHIHLNVLKRTGSITNQPFPHIPQPDPKLSASMAFSRKLTAAIGQQEGNMSKKASKGKETAYDVKKEKKITIYTTSSWPQWQGDLISLVRENLKNFSFDTKAIMPKIDKKNKKAMPFVVGLKKQLEESQSTAPLDRETLFDEMQVLEEMRPGLLNTIYRCKEVEIVKVDANASDLPLQAQAAEPGQPSIVFNNI